MPEHAAINPVFLEGWIHGFADTALVTEIEVRPTKATRAVSRRRNEGLSEDLISASLLTGGNRMSKIAGRNDASGLRVLLSQQTISRRGLLLSSLAGATSLALAGGSRYGMAADSSLRSLTYSGQRWGMVQEGMAPQFAEATGVEVEVVTFPISQGYARILNALGIGSSEYDVIDLDYGILAQVANRLEPLDPYVESDWPTRPTTRAPYRPTSVGSIGSTGSGSVRAPPTELPTTATPSSDFTERMSSRRPASRPHRRPGTRCWRWPRSSRSIPPPASSTASPPTASAESFLSTLFGQMLFSYGGNWLDENNAPTLTTPEAEEALSMIEKLMPYADPSVVNAGDNETISVMASGVAVYAPNAWGNNAFTNPQLNDLAEVTKAVIVPRGAVPNGKNSPLMGGFGLVIPATAKNKEAAWKFIQFLTSKDNMKAYVEFSGQPARIDALKEYASVAPMFSALADSLPNGVYQPGWLRDQSGFYQALGTQVSLVMTGQQSVSRGVAAGTGRLHCGAQEIRRHEIAVVALHVGIATSTRASAKTRGRPAAAATAQSRLVSGRPCRSLPADHDLSAGFRAVDVPAQLSLPDQRSAFVGLDNYIALFRTSLLARSVLRTLEFAAGSLSSSSPRLRTERCCCITIALDSEFSGFCWSCRSCHPGSCRANLVIHVRSEHRDLPVFGLIPWAFGSAMAIGREYCDACGNHCQRVGMDAVRLSSLCRRNEECFTFDFWRRR